MPTFYLHGYATCMDMPFLVAYKDHSYVVHWCSIYFLKLHSYFLNLTEKLFQAKLSYLYVFMLLFFQLVIIIFACTRMIWQTRIHNCYLNIINSNYQARCQPPRQMLPIQYMSNNRKEFFVLCLSVFCPYSVFVNWVSVVIRKHNSYPYLAYHCMVHVVSVCQS